MTSPEARECWFLTGSQAMYGPEALGQVGDQSKQIATLLDQSAELDVPVIWKPVLLDPDSIRRTMLAANADDNCVGVIIWMHTFSPAKMWIAGLDALAKPLLHLHTQANVELPWGEIDMDFMNLNQAAHGDREVAYIQTRIGIHRKTVVGHVASVGVRERIAAWQRAAVGVHAVRSLKLARFGDNMREVAVTEGDKVEAQLRLGVSVNTYGVNELVDAVDAVGKAAIDELVDAYLADYDVVEALRPGGEQHESLRYGARIEAGLRQFLTAGGFGAFTTNFEDLGGLRQLPGLAVQRLMADGYGFGGEGDWKTSVLLHAAKAMGAGRTGGSSFMEDYTYDFGTDVPLTLGAHMLEVCPTIAARKPRLEIHPLSIGGREDPVRLVFDAAPSQGIVVGLADMGERLRLVLNEITIVTPPEPLPKLPVARAVWAPAPSLETSAECWLSAGGPHHTVLSTAVGVEEFRDFAQILGVELAMITASTDAAGFQDQLRWNQAYYRLAQGF
jgi:L-arabinose isomerase